MTAQTSLFAPHEVGPSKRSLTAPAVQSVERPEGWRKPDGVLDHECSVCGGVAGFGYLNVRTGAGTYFCQAHLPADFMPASRQPLVCE